MSNNNDLPSWLDAPDSGGGDEEENSSAALPPWLQEKPPAPPEDAGSLPPWLLGDEPPKPKTAMIGGAELSEEYLSAGDRLVEHVESEITYDEWMAQKYEDERPKSIEEEIPDLLSDADTVAQTGSLGTGSLPHTGQLPDWFLGLDALDERDVPDWFKDAQEIEPPTAPVAPGEVAPWMRDMVQPAVAPAEPPVMPELDEDEVASFFRGMDSPSETDADWFSETTGNEAALPDDDFYAQFGAKPPVAEPDADAWMLQPPPQPDLPDLPDMGSFLDAVDSTSPMAPIEDYELPAEPEPDYDADLPPIELNDDFFTAVAVNRERTATESPDAVEDPDLSWFLNMPQTSMLGGETVEESEPAPTQISRPADTGTLSWLNEIQGMVQSATHPDQPDDKSDIEQPSVEDWNTFADAAPSGRAADFTWDDQPEPEDDFTPQEPAPDWLNAVSDLPPDAIAEVEEEPFEGTFFTPPPVPPPAARLTGMLNAGQLPPDESEMGDEWDDIPVTAADLDWQEITEVGWSNTPAAAEHGDVDEGGVAETDMSDFLRGLNLEPHDAGEPVEEGFSLTNALRDWENPAAAAPLADPEDNFSLTDALRDWDALAVDAADDDLPPPQENAVPARSSSVAEVEIPDEELHSGWLTDDLFADIEDSPRQESAAWSNEEERDPDFFSLLETDADLNVIVDPNAPAENTEADWMSEIEALQDEMSNAESPTAVGEEIAEPSEEMFADLFAASGDAAAFGDAAAEDAIGEEIAEPSEEMFADLFAASGDAAATDEDAFGDEIAEPSEEMFADLFAEPPADAVAAANEFDARFAELLAATDPDAPEPDPGLAKFPPADIDRFRVTSQEMEVLNLDDADKDTLPEQLTPDLLPGEDEFPGFDWAQLPEDEPLPASQSWEDAIGGELPEEEAAPDYEKTDLAREWAQQLETDIVPESGDELPADEDIFTMFEELEEPEPEFELPADNAWLLDDADPINQMLVPASDEPSFDELSLPSDALADAFAADDALYDYESPDFDALFSEESPAPQAEAMSPIDFSDADTLFGEFDMAKLDDQQDAFANAGEYGSDFDLDDLEFDAVKAFQSDEPSRYQPPAQYVGDIDDYLASLSSAPEQLPTEQPLFAETPDDLDSLFAEPIMKQSVFFEDQQDIDTSDLAPATDLDWLGASVGTVSATAIARQIKDEKQPEELTERLKKLRQRAEKLPAEADAPPDDSLAKVLPGVNATLAPAPLRTDEVQSVSTLTLTPEQSTRVDLLKSMLALDVKPRKLSAIELTYDSPFAPDLADSDESIVHEKQEIAPVPVTKTRRRINLPLERWLIAAILILAVIAPFYVSGLRIGDLPPAAFAPDSRQAIAFERMNVLQPGDLVLIGVEYGAAAAGELDLMTDALIRHALLLGARPVIISGNPVALLRTNNLIAAMHADNAFMTRLGLPQPLAPPLAANSDYFVVRFLPGNVLGLRAFSQDSAELVVADIQGQATNLFVDSLADFVLVVVVTDSADDVRAYAEQIAPLADRPLLAAISYSAAPLTEPYANSELANRAPIDGLLVGYGDAYTYSAQLPGVNAVLRRFVPPIPTPEPTPTRLPPTPTPEPTADTAGAAAGANAEATAEVTPEATEPAEAVTTAIVIAEGSARLRSGPGTNFDIVDAVATGTRLTVIGFNEAEDWVNVRLEDGQEGWISEPLLRIEVPQSAAPKASIIGKPDAQEGEDTPTPSSTPTRRATSTPRPTRTPSPTAEATAEAVSTEEAAPPAAFFIPPPTLDARDARWYAQTLGIIVIVGVITFGMIINLVRALLRRGRSSP